MHNMAVRVDVVIAGIKAKAVVRRHAQTHNIMTWCYGTARAPTHSHMPIHSVARALTNERKDDGFALCVCVCVRVRQPIHRPEPECRHFSLQMCGTRSRTSKSRGSLLYAHPSMRPSKVYFHMCFAVAVITMLPAVYGLYSGGGMRSNGRRPPK